MAEVVRTLLDAVAVLLVAAGVVVASWPHVGGFALCLGGVVVGLAVLLSSILEGGE